MDIGSSVTSILIGILVFSFISFLYKRNPLYRFVQAMMIAVVSGNLVVVSINVIQGQIVNPLVANLSKLDLVWPYILALIVGMLYFTNFSRNLIILFRTVTVITILSTLGMTLPGSISSTWVSILGKSKLIDISAVVGFAAIIFTLLYGTFGKTYDSSLKNLRQIGRIFVLAWVGFSGGVAFVRPLGPSIGWVMTITRGPGVYVGVAALLIIIVDKFVGWRRILGLKPPKTSKTSSSGS